MQYLKLFFVVFLLSSFVLSAQGNGNFAAKLGVNFSGKFELDQDGGGSEDGDVGTGFEVDLEYLYHTSPQLIVGGGAGYLFSRSGEDSPDDFSIIPIYGLLKYEIQTEGNFIPAVEGRIGYNFISYNSGEDGLEIDTPGGLHFGVALSGLYNKQFLIGIGYYSYSSSAEATFNGFDVGSGDATYSCITLSVGMVFGGK